MILHLYEVQYIDNRETVPATDIVRTKKIAMSKIISGQEQVIKYLRFLAQNGYNPMMKVLSSGDIRIFYTALPSGLKYDKYYKGGTYYRGKDVFHNDIE